MHIAIIGNGIAGITAARHIRKLSGHDITVISSESPHFFSRTALMYLYMGHMRFDDIKPYPDDFWEKNRIRLVQARVDRIEPENSLLHCSDGQTLTYDKLLIATGSRSNFFGWPGQDLDGVHGLYHLQDLEAMERHSRGLRRAVITGGGLIGIEMAEMFHARHIPVTFLVRENSFWNNILPSEESAMINRHIRDHGIDLRLGTELSAILDDGAGRAGAVITSGGETLPCGFVGITTGVSPNIEWLKGSGIATRRGILVNQFLETNIPGIYAAGDCAELEHPRPGRRAIEAVWYTGRMMGETAAYNLCGYAVGYDPGIWFNAAKFFDIEYQVYGIVPARETETHASLYWEHPGGRKSIRLVYERTTNAIAGFNLMGIRYRHEVCEQWILRQTPLEEVLRDLRLANFDPEFFTSCEAALVDQYKRHTGRQLHLRRPRGWDATARFLGLKNA